MADSSWGVDRQPDHLRACRQRPRPSCRPCSTRSSGARQGRRATCRREPARKLKNLQNIPVLFLNGEGGYHRDLRSLPGEVAEPGRREDRVRRDGESRPGRQRAHDDAREEQRRHRQVHGQLAEPEREADAWRRSRRRCRRRPSRPSRPTTSRAKVSSTPAASTGVKPARKSCAARCTPKCGCRSRSASANPVVLFHGNGQTGVDWLQTPDGRAGWAYYLVDQGYVVYMVDYPARGRSAYVPVAGPGRQDPIDGNLGIRTGSRARTHLDERARARRFPAEDEPHAVARHRQDGRPDLRQLRQDPGAVRRREPALAREAGVALLEMIGTPVVLLTHSQGGGIGFDITEARPQLVKAMVTVEPGGPQIGSVNTATVEAGPRNPNSWGLTTRRVRVRSAGESAVGFERRISKRNPSGPTRRAAGCRWSRPASWREWKNIRGAVDFRQRHLPSRLRSVYSEMAQSGGRQDRFRAARNRRHHRQQPHDDAREEQRRRSSSSSSSWIQKNTTT